MRRASVVLAVSLALVAALSIVRDAAADARFHGHGGGGRFGGGRSFHTSGHFVHNRAPAFQHHGPAFQHHGFGGRRFVPRHFGGFGVVIAPPVVVYSPFADEASPLYSSPPYSPPLSYSAPPYAPPVIYSPPAVSEPPPAPLPRVIEYPTGRYELRGDGINTPYTWVWIPNPPPPPTAPPTPPPPAGAPMSKDTRPAGETQIYQWKDEHGVVHWTNRLQTIPLPYREEAKRLTPS